MSDDQIGCEWVSVSSGTGLPELSRTEAVKWLCVCVSVNNTIDTPPGAVGMTLKIPI